MPHCCMPAHIHASLLLIPAGLWSRCDAGRCILAMPSLVGKQARAALGELLADSSARALHVISLVWCQPPDVPAQSAQLLPATLHALYHTAHGTHKPQSITIMTSWPCASCLKDSMVAWLVIKHGLFPLPNALHGTRILGVQCMLAMQGILKRVENFLQYWYWTLDDWKIHRTDVQAL